MAEIYLILNESLHIGGDTPTTEIVGVGRYEYEDILDDLLDIAKSRGVVSESGSTSVYVPTNGTHLDYDEYYIISLEVKDRG